MLCSIPAVIIACTALSSADDNFGRLLSGITGGFFDNFFTNVIIFAVSIPLSFLLFGAMSGAKGRKRKMTGDLGRAAKVPAVAICSALTPLILIYLFVLCLPAAVLSERIRRSSSRRLQLQRICKTRLF